MRKHFGREQNGNGSAARLCHNLDLLQGCQTILTFYKGVSHVVIGMAIIILSEDRVVLVLPKLVNLFGALQLVLGSVLLRGITKVCGYFRCFVFSYDVYCRLPDTTFPLTSF
jgi:hypothetical protein